MLPCFVMLDLETTGGNATKDRITEIAAVRVENGIEVARWSTLVNPDVPISPFIQSLTGISDAMVANAPRFEEVATPLLEVLRDAVLVAHNVHFDHSFVQHALQRLGLEFTPKTLCTVRLSRKLYPNCKGHGLDAITERHGLHNHARHRAMGDVDVVLAWLSLATRELGIETVRKVASTLLQGGPTIPPQLQTRVTDIPECSGVYILWGESASPLFVGKASNLRARVMWHFQSAPKVAREMRITQEVRRVQWYELAGNTDALLLENRLRKELHPLYNRKISRTTPDITE